MSIDEALLHLQIDGWFVIEGVIPANKVGVARAEAEAVTAAQGVSRTYRGLHSARGILDKVPSFLPTSLTNAYWALRKSGLGRMSGSPLRTP